MKTLHVAIFALIVSGCATVGAPKELLSARSANKRASVGVTARLNAADLHAAKESLKEAEQYYSENGDIQETRDRSYVADLGFRVAESRARAMQTLRTRNQTLAQMRSNILAHGERTSAELGLTKQRLASQDQALENEQERRIAAEKRADDQMANQMAGQDKALVNERQRRIAAEKLADEMAAELARIGAVKKEPRGTVLTLSGEVLFATNSATLLPSAQAKLDEVATALIKQSPKSKIVVEGHTDSQGPAKYNQSLSQRRAAAVHAYLVSRGVARDRITSRGFGLTRPIADNSSPEGRANNRRVEIVLPPTNP